MGKGRKAGIVNAVLGLDISKFSTNLQNAQRSLKKSGQQFQKFGKSMTRSLTLPLGIAGGLAVKTFADFEQSMAKVQAISGATSKEFEQLKENALELGRTTRYTASEVAELQLNLSKLGLSTAEITASTDSILALSLATGEDLAESATVAAGVMRAFGLQAEDMGRVTDVMASSFSNSALNLEKFKVAMSTAAPVARKAGADLERTTAIMGVLTNNSIDASTAGTALRNIFLDLAASGMTWDEAMNAIRSSSNPLNTALEMFGKRSTTVATVIAENAEQISKLNKTFDMSAGEAKRMAGVMDNTLNGAFLRLKSAVEGVMIDIGDRLSPVVNALTGFVTKLASAFSALPNSVKNTIVVVSALAAAIGPLAFGIGKLLTITSSLMGVLVPLGLSMTALAGTVGVVVAAFAALAISYRKNTREQSTFVKNLTAEKAGMDAMFAVLKRTKKGTEARAKAIKEVNERYGEYLPNQLSEKSNLNDIESAQRAANKELLRSILLKSRQEDLEAANKKAVDDTRNAMERLRKVAEGADTKSSGYLKKAGEAQADALLMGILGAVEEFGDKGSKAVLNEITKLGGVLTRLGLGGVDTTEMHNAIKAMLNAENNRLLTIQDTNKEYERLASLLKITKKELNEIEEEPTGGGGNGGAKEIKRRGGIIEPMQGIGLSGIAETMARDTPKTVGYITKIGESLAGLQYRTQMATASWMEFTTKMSETAKSMIVPALETIGYELGRALGQGGFKNGELGKALIDQIMQFASMLGDQLIAIGSALLLAPGMQGAAAGYLAAGGLLKVGAAIHRGFVQASMSKDMTNGAAASGMVNGRGPITVEGQIRGDHLVILSSDYQRRRR